MRIMVFALSLLLRQYDDVKEIRQMGFTRDQIIEISKKLGGIRPAIYKREFLEEPDPYNKDEDLR
jgi:hypothetical protein